jgi:hypothetical protein
MSNYSTRRAHGQSAGNKLVKALALLVATAAGYVLGVRVIGPACLGRPVAVGEPAPVPAQPVAPPGMGATPDAATANGAQSGAASNDPTALVTPGRHHRTDYYPTSDAVPTHHKKIKPAERKSPAGSAGDQSLSADEHGTISGADNEAPGSDSSLQTSGAGASSVPDATPTPDAPMSPGPAVGDSSPNSVQRGDTPGATSRRRRHDSGTSPIPAPSAPGDASPHTGDSGAVTPSTGPGDQSGASHNQGTAAHGGVRYWAAVCPDSTGQPDA